MAPAVAHDGARTGDLPIADAAILAKIEDIDEEMEILRTEVSHICKSVQILYSSILSLTRTAPSVAASMYLNRTDVHAQYLSGTSRPPETCQKPKLVTDAFCKVATVKQQELYKSALTQ